MATVAAETGIIYKVVQWLWVVLFPLIFGWWVKERDNKKKELREAEDLKKKEDEEKESRFTALEEISRTHDYKIETLFELNGRQDTKLDAILDEVRQSKSQQDKYFAVFDYIQEQRKNDGR